MKIKKLYDSPSMEVMEVKNSGIVLASADYNGFGKEDDMSE